MIIYQERYRLFILIIGIGIIGTCNVLTPWTQFNDAYIALAQSNFISIVPNLLLLVIIFRLLSKYDHLKNELLPRTGQRKFLFGQLGESVMCLLWYLVVQYTVNLATFSVPSGGKFKVLIIFLILNTLMLISCVLLLNLINFNFNGIIVFLISVVINLVFHYWFIVWILSRLYDQA